MFISEYIVVCYEVSVQGPTKQTVCPKEKRLQSLVLWRDGSQETMKTDASTFNDAVLMEPRS